MFNALARLSDERAGGAGSEAETPQEEAPLPRESAASEAVTQAPRPPASPARDPAEADEEAIPDDVLEFDPTRTDVADVFVDPPPNPQWTAATGSFKAMIAAGQEPAPDAPPERELEVEVDAAFLASMLRGDAADAAPASTRSVPPPPAPSAVTPPATSPRVTQTPPAPPKSHEPRPRNVQIPPPTSRPRPGGRHAAPHARPAFDAEAQPPPAPRAEAAPPATGRSAAAIALAETAHEDDPFGAEAKSTAHLPVGFAAHLTPRVWRIGAGVAALLLLAQIINHYRDDLAATARFNRPLTALYAALGVRLVPRWDVRAYDVRQLGASVESGEGGLITVRASIKNGAQHPQPLPLLRVTLQDRFGNRIASSDVAPRFYLPPAVPASSFLSGGQRIDAEMGFVDPGASAVGFEIDACLPSSGGGVTCANDAGTR